MFKKWWHYLILLVVLVLIYYVLAIFGLVPWYWCGSTMGPNGPVPWCQWHTGLIVG